MFFRGSISSPSARGVWAVALVTFSLSGPILADIRFRDAASRWRIDFIHHHGGSGERYMVETSVGGVVIFDYDGDGDEDLFFVDGGVLPGYQGAPPRSRLLRNDGPGTFVDVTDRAGIDVDVYGAGGSAADIDGDGDLDLLVSAFGPNQLWRNQGDGTFEEIGVAAGVADPRWSMGAVFADFDGDGDLDLYVANYVDFALDNHKFCGDRARGIRGYCHPDVYNGLRDGLYLNESTAEAVRFVEVSSGAGLATAAGAGLGVIATDIDRDGWPDLYVTNDLTPNFLFRNRGAQAAGDVRFEDLSLLSGTAYSDRGRVEAGMGVAAADLDGNGLFDLLVTNFELETNATYYNLGGGTFSDGRYQSGLAEPSLRKLGFGVAFADFDLDGDQDLVVANGHILDNAEILESVTPYRQPNQVFENDGRGRFRELSGTGLDVVRASRGLACGDLDLDGDLDIVIVNSNDRAEAYENVSPSSGNWLGVDLLAAEGNRFGIGAVVELAVDEKSAPGQLREVRTGSSYLSQNEMTLFFGLGDSGTVETLTIHWPGGFIQIVRGLRSGARVRLRR